MSLTGISTPKDLLSYFNKIKGKGIVSGEFAETGDPASTTIDPLARLQSATGQYVGLTGFDYWHFGTSGPAVTANANADAIANWKAGGLVELSLSMPNPTTGGGIMDTSYLDAAGLLTPGTATNNALNTSLSQVAAGLKQLQDAGVVVLLRPYHESNGNWFWWGAGELSSSQFQALWQYTYNYMTNTMGLHNLDWVYSINAGTVLPGRTLTDTYPGSNYVDITGQDLYTNNPGSDGQATYQALAALGKPTALAEFGSGSPSNGNPNFSMPTLVSQIQANMPNTVYWLQWWAGNGGGTGWGIEQDQNAATALNDGYVINRGRIVNATQPPSTSTPSPNNTVVTNSSAAIADASGNKWTITAGGQVAINGIADAITANVIELAYVNGTVWQENASLLWWGKTAPSASWSPGAGTSTSPVPIAKLATITLDVSEDAYLGDAQYTVKVDGTQIGDVRTAKTLHSSGDSDVVSLTGNWGVGAHALQLQFINDAFGGTPGNDRNLYVNSIALNGAPQSGTTAAMYSNATSSFTMGGTNATMAGSADTLSLHLSEDAYNGDAQFILAIDGKQISMPQNVTASHSAGAWQTIAFAGSFGAGSHTVGITFTNDAYGGTASTDRNLYANGIDVNGKHYGSGTTAMMSAGTTTFNIATTH